VATQDAARVLLLPSCSSTAVPEAEAYWHELTRFHARMLQCFAVFVNRVGSEGGLEFWGGSHVIGPDGTSLVEGPRFEEAILYADLDLDRVDDARRRLTIARDPRLDLVRAELERLVRNRGHAPR
jgi:predicted amidohydrolase